MFKSYVVASLAKAAKKVLAREKPEIIGVTGSVGKSSAKEAVGLVLRSQTKVRVSPKNFNTEIGLPLSILGLPNGHRSAWKWLGILRRARKIARRGEGEFPKVLVLEMGVEHPGDMKDLLAIARPKIGVVTAVSEAHEEFFGSVAAIAQEKGLMVEALPEDGWAILNRDDENVWAMRERTKASVVSFGFHDEADVQVLESSIRFSSDPDGEFGMHVKLSCKGIEVPMFLPGMLGAHSLYAVLAAFTVGAVREMNLLAVAEALRSYEAPAGRMKVLKGIKRTLLIDDSYNASPRSVKAAIAVFKELKVVLPGDDKKIAVLGDMLELGARSQEYHEDIGRAVAASGATMAVFVGERMGDAERAAIAAGMKREHVSHFANVEEAGRYVQQQMKQGDIVLVKGSQGMRMEKVVKELMAEPLMAKALLVRQDEEWEK